MRAWQSASVCSAGNTTSSPSCASQSATWSSVARNVVTLDGCRLLDAFVQASADLGPVVPHGRGRRGHSGRRRGLIGRVARDAAAAVPFQGQTQGWVEPPDAADRAAPAVLFEAAPELVGQQFRGGPLVQPSRMKGSTLDAGPGPKPSARITSTASAAATLSGGLSPTPAGSPVSDFPWKSGEKSGGKSDGKSWARAGGKSVGRLPVYRRHVAAASNMVRRALAECPGEWAVSCSGGKDSTALASLAVEAGWRGRLLHLWSQETPPENTALVAGLAARWGLPFMTLRVRGDWDAWEELGHAFLVSATEEERRASRLSNMRYKRDADAAARDAGLTGLMLGMRAEESRVRAIVVARHGTLYRTRDRSTATLLPLARWTARDVWARLLAEELPWLPRYDREPDRERARSEITWLGFEGLWRRGQIDELRRDHDLWARVTARWPELANG